MAPLLIAGLAALASAGINQINGNSVLKKQAKQTRAGIRDAGIARERAMGLTDRRIDDLNNSDTSSYRDSSLGDYMRALATAKGYAPGDGSNAYDSLADTATDELSDYGADSAQVFSGLDAPLRQRQAEATATGDLTLGLDRIRDSLAAQQYRRQLKISQIRPNPWLSLVSGALGGLGGAIGAGAFSGGNSAGAVNSTRFGGFQNNGFGPGN